MKKMVWVSVALGTFAGACHSSRNEDSPPNPRDVAIALPTPAPPTRDTVQVPAGEFRGVQPRCKPGTLTPARADQSYDSQHRHVDAYAIDRRWTSCEAFKKCVAAGRCGWTQDRDLCLDGTVEVGLDHAMAYCAWVGGQLPSVDEWQRAARGTEGRLFVFEPGTPVPEIAPGQSYRYLGPEGVEFEMFDVPSDEHTRDRDCGFDVGSVPKRNDAGPDRVVPVTIMHSQQLFLVTALGGTTAGFRCVYEDKAGTKP